MKRLLRFGVSAAILLAALYVLDLNAIGAAIVKVSVPGLACSLIVTLLVYLILAWRWYLIVQPLAPRPWLDHFKHYSIATYLNLFTPSALGADLYRVVSLRSSAPDTGTIIIAVLRERVVGLLGYLSAYAALVLWLAASGARLPSLVTDVAALAALGGCALLALPLLLTGPIRALAAVRKRPALERMIAIVDQAARIRPWRTFVAWLGLSLLGIALWVVAVKIVAADLGVDVSWPLLAAIVVLTELLRMLPVTIHGIGLREATFAYLLALLGGSAESGFALGAISYAVLTVSLLFCGIAGWLLLQLGDKPA